MNLLRKISKSFPTKKLFRLASSSMFIFAPKNKNLLTIFHSKVLRRSFNVQVLIVLFYVSCINHKINPFATRWIKIQEKRVSNDENYQNENINDQMANLHTLFVLCNSFFLFVSFARDFFLSRALKRLSIWSRFGTLDSPITITNIIVWMKWRCFIVRTSI